MTLFEPKPIGSKRVKQAGHGKQYIVVKQANGIWEYEHRLIMVALLGRSLYQNEIVHHIDGDGLNNNASNLMVMDRAEHGIAEYYK